MKGLLTAKYKRWCSQRRECLFPSFCASQEAGRFSPHVAEGLDLLRLLWAAGVSCVLENPFPCAVLHWFHPIPAGWLHCMLFCSWLCLPWISFCGWSQWGFIGRKINPFFIWTDYVFLRQIILLQADSSRPLSRDTMLCLCAIIS